MKEEEFRYKDNTEPAFSGYEPDNQHPVAEHVSDQAKRIEALEGALREARECLSYIAVFKSCEINGLDDDEGLFKRGIGSHCEKTLKTIDETLKRQKK